MQHSLQLDLYIILEYIWLLSHYIISYLFVLIILAKQHANMTPITWKKNILKITIIEEYRSLIRSLMGFQYHVLKLYIIM